MDLNELKYPNGKFKLPPNFSPEVIHGFIKDIEQLPNALRLKSEVMAETQLDTAYRPGGWTGRQVIHHLADSHMNAFIRFKLSVTEQGPTIKPYNEVQWALLSDSKLPIDSSLQILEGVHVRWTNLLQNFELADFERFYIHPATESKWTIKMALALYAWHGKHHLGHLNLIK